MDFPLKKGFTTQVNNKIETIKVVSLRDPTWSDTVALPPCFYSEVNPATGTFQLRMDPPAAGRWIERLSGRTEVELGQMRAAEGRKMADWIFAQINDDDDTKPEDAIKNSVPPSES